MQKLASQIRPGDKLEDEDGVVRIKAVERGFVKFKGGKRSIMLIHNRGCGWTQVPHDEPFEVMPK